MQHKRLGRTGLKVSRLCLGTMTFGNQCEETLSHEILDYAFESGISFIDTADIYPANGKPDLVGETENIIGRWIKHKREEIVLATKFWAPTGSKPWQGGSSRRNIKDSVEASLRRLKTDYIDLYFEDYLKNDSILLQLDWGDHLFEGETFQLKGQVMNQEIERLADSLLEQASSSET